MTFLSEINVIILAFSHFKCHATHDKNHKNSIKLYNALVFLKSNRCLPTYLSLCLPNLRSLYLPTYLSLCLPTLRSLYLTSFLCLYLAVTTYLCLYLPTFPYTYLPFPILTQIKLCLILFIVSSR